MADPFLKLVSDARKAARLAADAARSPDERKALLGACIERWEAAASEALCDEVRQCCIARAANASRARETISSSVLPPGSLDGRRRAI